MGISGDSAHRPTGNRTAPLASGGVVIESLTTAQRAIATISEHLESQVITALAAHSYAEARDYTALLERLSAVATAVSRAADAWTTVSSDWGELWFATEGRGLGLEDPPSAPRSDTDGPESSTEHQTPSADGDSADRNDEGIRRPSDTWVTLATREYHGRVPANSRTQEAAFYHPILSVLVSMGGRGRVAPVLDRVGAIMTSRMLPADFESLNGGSGGPIRWRNTARWARNQMVDNGLLRSGSPFGIWEISDMGRAWLADRHHEEQGESNAPGQH